MQKSILVVSRTFLPKEGGIEEYVYNRCLQDPSGIIVLAANFPGADAFDEKQPFAVHRWPNPAFLNRSLPGRLIKQVLCLVWSLVMGIQLYQKYRYRYIEWGHGYDFPSVLILSYLLPIEYFIYLHGNDLLCPLRNPVFKSAFNWTLKRAAGIVCNSSFTSNYLKSHFSVSVPIHIVNPAVRPTKFGLSTTQLPDPQLGQAIRGQYGIPNDAVLILSVGRLVKRKGFDRIITQLPSLLRQGLDVHYLVCGRGAMEAELRNLATDLKVAERVHFAGYVDDQALAQYYSACDLFSMLTFFNADAASIEGFGIVYVEAGFFGKPVIASRIGGVVDAVHHLENGVLVEPEASADELLAALSQLCGDAELRHRLGARGEQLADRQPSYQALYPSAL